MLKKNTVAIISDPIDAPHVHAVIEHIDALGYQYRHLTPRDFGTTIDVAMDMSNASISLEIGSSTESMQWDDVCAVWYRKPELPTLDHVVLAPSAKKFAIEQWMSLLRSFALAFPTTLWVSAPYRQTMVDLSKPAQLSFAQRFGLRIPRTCITNRLDQAQSFIRACGGQAIVKPLKPLPRGEGDLGNDYALYTNRVTEQDIGDKAAVAVAPTIFQEEIRKRYELRVNIVGQRVLAIRIDSQASLISELDWRRYDLENTPYSPYQLPPEIEVKLLRLVRHFGLEFAAIDMICDQNGNYVFIELNSNGQFLWAEHLAGVSVSRAIAELLCGQIVPLQEVSIGF